MLFWHKRSKRQTGERLRRVCVIVFPSHWLTTRLFIADLARILEPISDKLYVITGNMSKEDFSNEVHYLDLKMVMYYSSSVFPQWLAMPFWAVKILAIQVKMLFNFLRISGDVGIVMFYPPYFYQLPLLAARVLGKRTLLLQTSTISKERLIATAPNRLMGKLRPWIWKAHCSIADYIVPESEVLAGEYSEFGNKVLPYGARFVDMELFQLKTPIDKRENLIGYIGRLSLEKGLKELIEAMPMVLERRGDVKFLIIGGGPSFEEVRGRIRLYPDDRVLLKNWQPHSEIPDYLNKLKLLVFPSYTEGLPTGILEAFACGTPVLATPVGAVTELIKDGETGFICEDNSPQCIARNILRAIEHQDLPRIVESARKLIEQRYSYQAAVERFSSILAKVEQSN